MDSDKRLYQKGDAPNKGELIRAVLQQFGENDSQKLLFAEALLHKIYRKYIYLIHVGSHQYPLPHSYITARQNCGEDSIDYIESR